MMDNRKLLKNKLASAALVILGLLSLALTLDITVLVMMLMIAVPLFFAKENWIT